MKKADQNSPDEMERRLLLLEGMTILLMSELKIHRAILNKISVTSFDLNYPDDNWIPMMAKRHMRETLRGLADIDPAKASQLSRRFESCFKDDAGTSQ